MFTSNNDSFPVLYPVIDIFNHHFDSQVKWQFNKGTFTLYLEEKVEQEQQIFNNYAPKGNEELLMGYGFCIPNNPCDQVVFRLGQVPIDIHRMLRKRVPSHWQSETWDLQESLFYIRGISHSTSGYPNTYDIPELDCLRGIPPELAHSVYTILLASYEEAGFLGRMENEPRVWAATLNALLEQAETNLSAITRWNSELPDPPLTTCAKTASIYRAGQVKILEEVVSELKMFVEPLRNGEIGIEDAFQRGQAWSRKSLERA